MLQWEEDFGKKRSYAKYVLAAIIVLFYIPPLTCPLEWITLFISYCTICNEDIAVSDHFRANNVT